MEQYEALLSGSAPAQRTLDRTGKPNTWRWLCQQYFTSAEFKRLSSGTQTVRRQVLEATFEEPVHPGSTERFADFPVFRMTRKAIKVLRDRKQHVPEAANARLKAIRRVFAYALEDHDHLVSTNPARDVGKFKSASDGFHSWSIEEVVQYLDKHPPGSKARRALYLMLYTGVRRSDAVRLGKQMVKDGWLRYQPQKTRHVSAERVEVPLLPILAQELALMASDEMTFLVTEYGKPFSAEGFGNKFKDWCRQAGLEHCTSHGLRKAGATIAAENGATVHQLMAMYGWRSTQQAEVYTRAARQKKLAGDGMQFIRYEQN